MTTTMTRPARRLPPATGTARAPRTTIPTPTTATTSVSAAGTASSGRITRMATVRPHRERRVPHERLRAVRARRAARYRRRRAAVTFLVAGVIGGGALLADSVLTGPGGVPASAAGAGTAAPAAQRVVRAAPGDSLWSIAAAHRGDIAITPYVEELIDLNGGTRIEAGQLVRLP